MPEQKKAETKRSVDAPNYSDDEKDFIALVSGQAEQSRSQREQSHVELDGMSYTEYWVSNAKAANSYLRPRRNREDVRITSGITEEKKDTLLSNILNYDFSAQVESFDEKNFHVVELGDIMADLIRKSRQLESPRYDQKRIIIYDELFSQGNVFVEDRQFEYIIPQKDLTKMGTELKDMQWAKRIDKVYKSLESDVKCGLNVYLGNIRQSNIRLQPFIFYKRYITRPEAESLYGNWERWKNVPYDTVRMIDDSVDARDYNNYLLSEYKDGLVEEVIYQCRWTNNFAIFLNKVPMFPVKREKGVLHTMPLSSLSGESEYTIVKGDLRPIPNFAYCKSIPAKTKIDQKLFDEFLQALILKTRKSYKPPYANNTGYQIPPSIWYPGTIHDGINPEKLQEIGDNKGVTPAEFDAMKFIKGIIDDKSLNPIMEGKQQGGKQPARTALLQQRQSQIKMGLAIMGVVNLEYGLQELRLRNIMKYYTDPVDDRIIKVRDSFGQLKEKKVKGYQSFTVGATIDDGEKGNRIVKFLSEDEMPEDDQVGAEEELRTQITGKKTKINVVNVDMLQKMKFTHYLDIQPRENDYSELKAAMFEESAIKLKNMFPNLIQRTGDEYLARKIAINAHMDPDKLLAADQQQPMGQPMGNPAEQQPEEGGNQGNEPPRDISSKLKLSQPSKPTINTMARM